MRKRMPISYGAKHHPPIHLLREHAREPYLPTTFGACVDQIICADAEVALRGLPQQSVQCIVTSPPYFRQRDYQTNQQIGKEDSPDSYVQKLVSVFRECHRVLSRTGLLWLNLGDKYDEGQLLGMPWRVAFAIQKAGWLLRSDVIWHKTNAMPASVKNRPTTDHEYVFMFSKSPDYFYDADAVREPHVTFTERSRMRGGRGHFGKRGGTPEKGKNGGNPNLHTARWDQAFHPLGRNKRTVWQIPLSKYPDAHFAVFPEKLVETCILASTRTNDLVLDPFIGSGTTAAMAQKLGRHYVGIDCNEHYCALAIARVQEVQPALGLV